MKFCAMLAVAACAAPIVIVMSMSASAVDDKELCLADSSDADVKIKSCTAVIESHPDKKLLPQFLLDRGNSYIRRDKYDEAIRDFDEAIRLSPDSVALLRNRGTAYRIRGEKAGPQLDKRSQGKEVGHSAEDFELAIRDYTQAIKLNPKLTQAYFQRGLTYVDMREAARAIPDFDAAIKLEPKNGMFLKTRCGAKTIVGELQAALADCAIALKTTDVWRGETLAWRGYTYLKLRQYDNAINDFNVMLKLSPQKGFPLYGRGMAKILKGDKTGGEADVAAAKKDSPGIVDFVALYTGFDK